MKTADNLDRHNLSHMIVSNITILHYYLWNNCSLIIEKTYMYLAFLESWDFFGRFIYLFIYSLDNNYVLLTFIGFLAVWLVEKFVSLEKKNQTHYFLEKWLVSIGWEICFISQIKQNKSEALLSGNIAGF